MSRSRLTQDLLHLHDAGVGADVVDSLRLLGVLLLVEHIGEREVRLGERWYIHVGSNSLVTEKKVVTREGCGGGGGGGGVVRGKGDVVEVETRRRGNWGQDM